jgi:hypothetical protein
MNIFEILLFLAFLFPLTVYAEQKFITKPSGTSPKQDTKFITNIDDARDINKLIQRYDRTRARPIYELLNDDEELIRVQPQNKREVYIAHGNKIEKKIEKVNN